MSEDQNLVPAQPIDNIYCGTCGWTERTLIESGANALPVLPPQAVAVKRDVAVARVVPVEVLVINPRPIDARSM